MFGLEEDREGGGRHFHPEGPPCHTLQYPSCPPVTHVPMICVWWQSLALLLHNRPCKQWCVHFYSCF